MSENDAKTRRDLPRYPMNLAFVVQLERQRASGTARIVGRVEHVSSGEVREFTDRHTMAQFMASFFGAPATTQE